MRFIGLLSGMSLLLACSGGDSDKSTSDDTSGASADDTAGADCSDGDTDGDGLTGCDEVALGTDPDVADSDGDGVSDGDEAACVSDPLDASEQCYACGWPHRDPGDLGTPGAEVGDTIANLAITDQCGEEVKLWDFAEEYHILFMTAEW